MQRNTNIYQGDYSAVKYPAIAFIAVMVIGLTLRVPITALASVLPEVQRELSMSSSMAGFIAAIPIVCFGVGALFVSPLSRRFGTNRLLVLSTGALLVAGLVRPWGGLALFFTLTALSGLAIAVGNVLLPVIARRDFARNPGPVLAGATVAITLSGAIGAAVTVPLAARWGWQIALSSWSLLMLVALVGIRFFGKDEGVAVSSSTSFVWRRTDAWLLSLFFGLIASLFYLCTVWLPTLLPELARMSAGEAGAAASVFQAVGMIGAFLAPMLVPRLRRVTPVALGAAAAWVVGLSGLLLAPQLAFVWLAIAGVGQGFVFSMVWALIAARAQNLDVVRELSAMTQALGYCMAIGAPVAFGLIYDHTGSWNTSLLLPLGMAVSLIILTPFVATKKPIG